MWQQAFRDQIKADKKLLPSYKVCLLDLADQLYSDAWAAQRGCSSRDIGKRCACSNTTAYRAIKAAIAGGHLSKKPTKRDEPDIYTPIVRERDEARVLHLDETRVFHPSETQDLCPSVPSEERTLAPLALESEKESKEEGAQWVSISLGSPEYAAWAKWYGGTLQPNVQGEYMVPSRWPRKIA